MQCSNEIQPIAVSPDGVRRLLDSPKLSDVTIWRWEKRGLLDRVSCMRHRLYTVESVKRLVAGGSTLSR